jgi:hypothetical protein
MDYNAGLSLKRQAFVKQQRQISKAFLQQIMVKIFDNINNAGNDTQMKESMVFLLSSLSERIISHQDVLVHIEDVISKKIYCELNSNAPIVINTTLLLYEKYYKLNFRQEGHISAIFNAILTNITNKNPGVAVQAAVTLK